MFKWRAVTVCVCVDGFTLVIKGHCLYLRNLAPPGTGCSLPTCSVFAVTFPQCSASHSCMTHTRVVCALFFSFSFLCVYHMAIINYITTHITLNTHKEFVFMATMQTHEHRWEIISHRLPSQLIKLLAADTDIRLFISGLIEKREWISHHANA